MNFEDIYGIIHCEKPRWPVEILKNITAVTTPIAELTINQQFTKVKLRTIVQR